MDAVLIAVMYLGIFTVVTFGILGRILLMLVQEAYAVAAEEESAPTIMTFNYEEDDDFLYGDDFILEEEV